MPRSTSYAHLRAACATRAPSQPGTRFQVSLPTPGRRSPARSSSPTTAQHSSPPTSAPCSASSQRILDGIPHDDLAIQWDTAVEFALLESANIRSTHAIVPWFDDVLGGVVERAARQAAASPPTSRSATTSATAMSRRQHFVQPTDAGHLADVSRGVLAARPAPITWFHLPVPIERDDAAYFAPLAAVDAARRAPSCTSACSTTRTASRAPAAARSAAATRGAAFGVATECGFGRGPSERTPALLDLHAAVADAW